MNPDNKDAHPIMEYVRGLEDKNRLLRMELDYLRAGTEGENDPAVVIAPDKERVWWFAFLMGLVTGIGGTMLYRILLS